MTDPKPCDHKFVDSRCCLKCGWTPPKLSTFHDGMDWYIAESADDARALRRKFLAIETEPTGPEYGPMVELPADTMIGVLCNKQGQPDDHGKGVKRTAAEWAKRVGRGVLCSREF